MPRGYQTPAQNGLLQVGRGRGNDVQTATDARTSRRHFVIAWRDDGWFLDDQNSVNGTWIDGVAVTTRHLRGGERITAGDTALRFEV